jgi:hypothetical protein
MATALPSLGPSRRSDREHRDDCDDLSTTEDPIEIDRRPPGHLVSADQEGTNRAGAQAEARARTLALPFGSLAASLAAPPWTRAAGITVTPFLSYGSPNTRFIVIASRAWAITS